jgi:hypothetical protein
MQLGSGEGEKRPQQYNFMFFVAYRDYISLILGILPLKIREILQFYPKIVVFIILEIAILEMAARDIKSTEGSLLGRSPVLYKI